jgi:hypothetical protein
MGQYFQLVNIDRQEALNVPNAGLEALEITTSPGCGVIAYLLLDGPQDGTHFIRFNADPDGLDIEDARKQDWWSDSWEQDYENDPERQRHSAEAIRQSYLDIDEANDYAGRWAGDRIMLVGDYSDEPYYNQFVNITDDAVDEWLDFIGKDLDEIGRGDLRPDMVLSSGGGSDE